MAFFQRRKTLNILFIGDIVGKRGRKATQIFLEQEMEKESIDFVIANGENATHGKGLNREHMLELLKSGVDVVTLGNHAFSKKEILHYIDLYDEILRPENLNAVFPGKGSRIYHTGEKSIRVTNLLGRAFMDGNAENPFDTMDRILNEEEKADIHIVDFHAEATGEKQSFAWNFDGKVTAILGTHTHVVTADERILPKGTAFQSDVGMVGPYFGILGASRKEVILKTRTGFPTTFELEEEGPVLFNGTLLQIDDATNQVQKIKRFAKIYEI